MWGDNIINDNRFCYMICKHLLLTYDGYNIIIQLTIIVFFCFLKPFLKKIFSPKVFDFSNGLREIRQNGIHQFNFMKGFLDIIWIMKTRK